MEKKNYNLEELQRKLDGKTGKKYWRSLDQVADSPEFQEWVGDEFPNRRSLLELDRRSFLKFMGASMALAGLSGCRGVFLDERKVVPYVKQPEDILIGTPLYYATAIVCSGIATGVLIETNEGRPTKLEGNPDHPSSLGSTTAIDQALLLQFYDPDRSSSVSNRGQIGTWDSFLAEGRRSVSDLKKNQGDGIRILTETVTSPLLAYQIAQIKAQYPKIQWHQYEAAGRVNAFEGAMMAFGEPVTTVYKLAGAKTIVSLDSDFLISGPGAIVHAREFADGRRILGRTGTMNRLYAFESTVTATGATADHRFAVKPSQIQAIATELLNAVKGGSANDAGGVKAKSLNAIAKDLRNNNGAAVVIPGEHQPAAVHALAHAINSAIGALGKTAMTLQPIEASPVNQIDSIKALVADIKASKVKTLLIVGGNPVFDAPADLDFAKVLPLVPLKVRHGLYEDETSTLCDWHLPATHNLEEWSDARGHDGTVSLIQPMHNPLHDAWSIHDLLASLFSDPQRGYELLKSRYVTDPNDTDGPQSKKFNDYLNKGIVDGSASPVKAVALKAFTAPPAPRAAAMEVVFTPDPTLYDGRYSNLGWLQELPRPMTKIVWDNPAVMSPQTMSDLKIQERQMVEVTVNGVKLKLGAFASPGHPDGVITIYYGNGRTKGGTVAEGRGFNVFPLRTSAAMGFATAEAAQSADIYDIFTTQQHGTIDDDRVVIYEHDFAEYLNPKPEVKEPEDTANLYPEEIFTYDGPQWGMTIDMTTCVGCNACVTACQSENNIPVVGKAEVSRMREMHWIRIDRYYQGNISNPTVVHQPVACVHCEKAPCEPVCPVAATVHSHEGLNQMVYNRCVGTRYCSNNCPYKVRRFNYLNWTDNQEQFSTQQAPYPRQPKQGGIQLLKMLSNPDVTVRGRGVMEKCTYCVQRINSARIEAKKAGTEIKDGAIVTACQQACPTKTIIFGNIADKNSEVSKWRKDPRGYKLMEELNTRPRTTHLAKLRNLNPEITA